METTMDQMVAHFKAQYSTIVSDPGHKFSSPLRDEMEIKARLCAAYEVHVELRGGQTDWDEVTNSSINNVLDWIFDCQHRWLILYGSLGTGKTTMLKALKTVFPSSVYCSAMRVFDEFKAKEILPIFPDNKLLLLDDLGAEPPVCKIFGEDRTPITDMLLRRYDWLATTVIATNLSIDDIQTRYGDRLADRIAEMAIAIQYDAPSYRGR